MDELSKNRIVLFRYSRARPMNGACLTSSDDQSAKIKTLYSSEREAI